MRMHWLAPLLLLLSCSAPNQDRIRESTEAKDATIVLGKDTNGRDCRGQRTTILAGASGTTRNSIVFYCGDDKFAPRFATGRVTWSSKPEDSSQTPTALATQSEWRKKSMDTKFDCDPPKAAQLKDTAASLLECKWKSSKAPHLGYVVINDRKAYYADGEPSASEALELAIRIATDKDKAKSAKPPEIDPVILADRRRAEALDGDATAEELMYAAGKANQTENFAEAEVDYRRAAEKMKGANKDYPRIAADPLTRQALQLSNLGQFAKAKIVFDQAEGLLRSPNPGDARNNLLAPSLDFHWGLHLINRAAKDQFDSQNVPDMPSCSGPERLPAELKAATDSTDQAKKYTNWLLAGAVNCFKAADASFVKYAHFDGFARPRSAAATNQRGTIQLNQELMYFELGTERARIGMIAVRQGLAVAYQMQGRLEDGLKSNAEAELLKNQEGLASQQVGPRIMRTAAVIYDAQSKAEIASNKGDPNETSNAASELARDAADRSLGGFNKAYPDTPPTAKTGLLTARLSFTAGLTSAGRKRCEEAVGIYKKLNRSGTSAELMMACIDALSEAGPTARDDMFRVAQWGQVGNTAVLLNTAVATAEIPELVKLTRERGLAEDEQKRSNIQNEIEVAEQRLGKGPSRTPRPQVVAAADVSHALGAPDTALVSMVLGSDHGWTFIVRGRKEGEPAAPLEVLRIDGGLPRVQALVLKIRQGFERDDNDRPYPFDSESAAKLYATLFVGPKGSVLDGFKRVIVAPSGPLLSLPFGLLLTGPAGAELSQAPWLVRKMTIEHVPTPGSFYHLRTAAPSRAKQPWIGFGAPVRMQADQVRRAYGSDGCSQREIDFLVNLVELDRAQAQLDLVRTKLGGTGERFVGREFTWSALVSDKINLTDYQVVHFATHGLLPSEVKCMNEGSIVASAPNQTTAVGQGSFGPLIKVSQIDEHLTFDANVVILAACNTAGPDGLAGEALSGLASRFFGKGAKSLLVAHWQTKEQALLKVIELTMDYALNGKGNDLAEALAKAQRDLLDFSTGANAPLAHPYYWSSLVLIGNGSVRLGNNRTVLSAN